MRYTEVIDRNLILPYKKKYTLADVNKVVLYSVFDCPKTFSIAEAAFIVKCAAKFHKTIYSKTVAGILYHEYLHEMISTNIK